MKFVQALVVCIMGVLAMATDAVADDPFWSLLFPIEAPELLSAAREGQVFLSAPVRHRHVGFLENDIRGTGIVNSDRIVVPRGTPVYRAAFAADRSRFSAGRQYEGWCGVVRENEGERGYCMLSEGRGFVLGLLPRNGSLYLPARLADYGLRPITTPEVRIDDAALEHFPTVTFSYALDAWRPGGLVLQRSATISGESFNLGSHWFERAEDGTANISVGQHAFTVSLAQGGEALTVVSSGAAEVDTQTPSAAAPIAEATGAARREASEPTPAARMAEIIARVCVAGMRSGEALSAEQFGDQFVFQRTRGGVTWLREARGQPWARLSINGSRPGSCSANFSDAGANSIRAATNLASEIRGLEWRRTVSVPGVSQAFTFPENMEAFDHDRDPYIAYVAAAGYQTFFFMPAAPDANRQR